LREAVPGLRRLALLGNIGYPAAVLEMSEVQAAARTLDLDVTRLEIRRAQDIAPAFTALKDRVDALYICTDALTASNRNRINTFALVARLPAISGSREQIEGGGLMSYGPNFPNLFRRAGDYVDKILRGAKPADLPIEQPTKFDLVINLITATALGLKSPSRTRPSLPWLNRRDCAMLLKRSTLAEVTHVTDHLVFGPRGGRQRVGLLCWTRR